MTSTPRSRNHPSERVDLQVLADAAELGRLRRGVVDWVRGKGGDRDASDALELAVSELATNVLQHTGAPEIHVSVMRTNDGWILDVASAEHLDLTDDVALPPVTERTGRGLFVVQSVMDSVSVLDVDDGRVVRATLATG